MFYTISVAAAGFLLDVLLGDPHWLPHPVCAVGKLISLLERFFRSVFPKTPKGELWGGALTAVGTVAITTAAAAAVLWICAMIHPALLYAVQVVMCYQLIAARQLCRESMRVHERLAAGDLPGARYAVSMIVGRDTEKLDGLQVTKAAVETVAENASDGVIAPLLFMVIGGAPLGFFYKAINTLDSMIGYKNEKYMYFGRFAAKLDDVANWVPARVSALLMIGASFLLGKRPKQAAAVWRRDRRNHASPNSAQTESVCAGALGIQLAGDTAYGGVVFHKPTIGDDTRAVETADIPRANALMYTASVLGLVVFSALRIGAYALWTVLV